MSKLTFRGGYLSKPGCCTTQSRIRHSKNYLGKLFVTGIDSIFQYLTSQPIEASILMPTSGNARYSRISLSTYSAPDSDSFCFRA